MRGKFRILFGVGEVLHDGLCTGLALVFATVLGLMDSLF